MAVTLYHEGLVRRSTQCAFVFEGSVIIQYGLNEGRIARTYLEVVIYLSQNYTTNDFIDETKPALTRYIQPRSMLPTQYVKALVT